LGGVAGRGLRGVVEEEKGSVLQDGVGAGTAGRLEAGRERLFDWVAEHVGTWTTSQIRQSENVTQLLGHRVLCQFLVLGRSEGVGLAQGKQWQGGTQGTGRC